MTDPLLKDLPFGEPLQGVHPKFLQDLYST